MNKPKVLWKNIYLEIPPRPGNFLELPEDVKKEVTKEYVSKLEKLKVWAVGKGVEDIKEGDVVMVSKQGLHNMDFVEFKEGGKTIERALVLDYHIVHIWP